MNSDSFAPLVVGAIFVVALLVGAYKAATAKKPKRVVALICLVAAIGTGIGAYMLSAATENTLDKRNADVRAMLAKNGIKVLEIDGNHDTVKVQKGDCTAWFDLTGGTLGWDHKQWPLQRPASGVTGKCPGGAENYFVRK